MPVSVTGNHQITAPVCLASNAAITVDPGSSLSISGAISGTGTGITKSGDGTLFLSGANSYTGGTNIAAGTLQMGSPAALGFGAAVPLAGTLPGTTVSGTLDLAARQLGGQITLAGGSLVNSSATRRPWARWRADPRTPAAAHLRRRDGDRQRLVGHGYALAGPHGRVHHLDLRRQRLFRR